MNRVIIAVGSNINPDYHIAQARQTLKDSDQLISESNFVRTTPIGLTGQADFTNGAFLIETSLNPQELKQWLRELEDALGRVRDTNKFGPRTLDLDIVVWNEEIVDSDVYSREFLKQSVLELCPKLTAQLQ